MFLVRVTVGNSLTIFRHRSTIKSDRNPSGEGESEISRLYGLVKSKFIDKEIPVIRQLAN